MEKKYQVSGGTSYDVRTLKEVVEVLEQARANDTRIRVWYGKDGKSWDEENDTIGYVGRSTGINKIPLLIYNKRSFGGSSLLDHCIVKIVDTKTNRMLYCHPKFSQSVFGADDTIVWEGAPGTGEEIYANCATWASAVRLADFMNGKRNNK